MRIRSTPLMTIRRIFSRRLGLLVPGVLLIGLLGILIRGTGVIKLPSAHAQSNAVRFAVIGDFGSDNQSELDVSNLVKSWNPDFIVTVGDNNYPYGEASTIDQNIGKYYHDFIYPYAGGYGAGATTNRFFPALGNHDWGDGFIWPSTVQPYTDYFTLPGNERYYDFARGPVHFFALRLRTAF